MHTILVTPKQMKLLEATSDQSGTSYKQLMLNAGNMLSKLILNHCNGVNKKVLFLCGNGNNAGDCFVSAKNICNDVDVTIAMLCGSPKTELSNSTFLDIPDNVSILHSVDSIIEAVSNCDVLCDGIFGTGFHGELPQDIQKILTTKRKAYTIAVDVPSGVDCLTGRVSKGTLKADTTITFAYAKVGINIYPAKEYCGNIVPVDIGISNTDYINSIEYPITLLTKDCVTLPNRAEDGNKGTFGRLLHITGSKTMKGACIMASKSALRSGVGLLTVCTEDYSIMPIAMPEPIYINRTKEDISNSLKKSTAVLIGCGLGTSSKAMELLKYVIYNAKCPIVIDADGINLLSTCIDIIKDAHSSIVLTPHPLEFSRLTGMSVEEVQANRLTLAKEFANKYNCTLVLKGANTIIADNSCAYIDSTANSGMAKGGSGDVLAGIVSSLLAQGMSPLQACNLGVYIHSKAGILCAKEYSKYSMQPTDLIEQLPNVFKSLT